MALAVEKALLRPAFPTMAPATQRGTIAAMTVSRLYAALLALLLATAAFADAKQEAPAAHPALERVQRAELARRSHPDDARRLADEALALTAAQPDADLEVRALLALCDYYAERDLVRARAVLARAGERLPVARRTGLRAGVLACEGELDEAAGDNAKAQSAYERAVSAAEAAADEEMLANALYLRGWLRGVQGEYALGLADMRRSLALYERGRFAEHARTAVNGIATIYNRMGDFAQAQHHFELAARAQLAAGLQREAVVTLYNLGRTRENLGRWEEARQAFEQALEISRAIGYPRGEAYAERGLAAVDNARGQWRESLERLLRAQRLADGLPDARLRAQLELARGVALRGLGRITEAIVALEAALDVFAKAQALADVVATRAALAAAYADLGHWRAAYEQQRLLKETGDRLHARQLDQRFLTLKVEFDTAAREQENALLQREKAAAEATLEHERRLGRLQAVAIALAAALAAALGALAWRQRRTSRTMRALAMTDELTGLPNRRALLARLAQLLDAGHACTVTIVDVDRFKAINDRLGHPAGDEALRAVAGVLAAEARGTISAGRLGGEEFMLIAPGADLAAAQAAAERVRAAVATLDTAQRLGGLALTVSVGIALARPGPAAVAEALRRADEALYAAKAAGRDCVRLAAAA
jgi:diguanylate cyclase (GGDEF)-like protein